MSSELQDKIGTLFLKININGYNKRVWRVSKKYDMVIEFIIPDYLKKIKSYVVRWDRLAKKSPFVAKFKHQFHQSVDTLNLDKILATSMSILI